MGIDALRDAGFSKARTGLLGLALSLAGCADDGPWLQTEYFETRPGEAEDYSGGACMIFDAGGGGHASSGSQGDPPLYEERYEQRGDAIHFELRDGAGELVAERNYDEAFVASGKRDEVSITVEGGHQFRFVHWGTEDCVIGVEPITKP